MAKENVDKFKEKRYLFERALCEEHKQSCQRFLEFLEKNYLILDERTLEINDKLYTLRKNLYNKILDLRKAIKLYEENNI